MGRKSTTGGVVPLGDRIQLYFRYQGDRCRPTLDLKPTPSNLIHARRLVREIEERIRQGTFDLAKEFPRYKGLSRFGVSPARALTFGEYVGLWQDSNTKLSPSTLNGYRKIFGAYWLKWFEAERIDAIKTSDISVRLGGLNISNKTFNNLLACGRVVFDLALADKIITDNPARHIEFLDVQKQAPDPFTIEEIDLILPALRKRWGEEISDYYEMAFFSGLRPNEQIELKWPDIELRTGSAQIRRGRVRGVSRETKTYSARMMELHSRARAVLERQRPRTQLADAHVFLNPNTGDPWHDEKRQRLMFASALKSLGIRHRSAYQTRHTYATILLMSDAKIAWSAGQMGHSVETFTRIYARWIHGADRGQEIAKVERFTDPGTRKTDAKS